MNGGMLKIARLSCRRKSAGFVLLEVIVAMVILGISIATLMRSFTMSLAAIRVNDATTQGTVLAETLLQRLEAEPPGKSKLSGSFEDEGFSQYGYEIEMDDQKIKYRLKSNSRVDGLRDLKVARIKITYDNPKTGKVTIPTQAYLILSPIERFSFQSKFMNEMFDEDEGV